MKYASLIPVAVVSLALFSPTVWSADPNAVVFTDPEKADKDFDVQGEYLGTVDDGTVVGIQVIALGNHEFETVAYIGGLPGQGWARGEERYRGKGHSDGTGVKFEGTGDSAGRGGVWKDGVIEVHDEYGDILVKAKKVERKSSTLGQAPPAGAIVLFDGSGVDQFEDAKLVDGKYLGATNCYTKQKFGDHQLHIEFRTPYMPTARGQGRGNSGVYLQSRYELQVLDSFGLEGENNECGGIYSISKPNTNLCFPPLSWQTYDIDFTAAKYDDDGKKTANARATIRHNGIVIHDDLELTHGTPGRFAEGPGPEAIFLQNHGNPVVFQNIWVVEK
ncbi:MAG: DUF1080 domain-containing protein [Planctomycetales bacterium]|nr:DUF1080 domain-containing protein [Planctomycetales bacterium]